MGIVLQDSTFKLISDFVYEKTGIYLSPNKKYLVENRLLKVIDDLKLKGYEEFYYLVKYSRGGKAMDMLLDAITTHETYFFREQQPLDVFIDKIVPSILESKRLALDIKIWSAACSTGEEPYTLSMLMKERRPNVHASIIGSDLSPETVKAAKKALFSSYSVRNVPEPYLKKYFTNSGPDYALNGNIANSVVFKVLNLVDKHHMAEMVSLDVIFCRNVLIYFDDKSKQKTVSFLYDSLRPGGYLIIGSSESLHNVTRAFKPTVINKAVVYQKV
jgi:chemotaxis protein methyltransferase CheR